MLSVWLATAMFFLACGSTSDADPTPRAGGDAGGSVADAAGAVDALAEACDVANPEADAPAETGECTGADTSACPIPAEPACRSATCNAGTCGWIDVPSGTALPSARQTGGNCKLVVCDGTGATREDDADDPPAADPCNDKACTAGVVVTSPKATGTPCAGGVCHKGACISSLCIDLAKDGSETDVDCGGTCPTCGDGATCASNQDCSSGVCAASHCVAPSCIDLTKNGDETDVDCGGPTCSRCAEGKTCVGAGDCASEVCSGTTCSASTCVDGILNGGEQALDCGGGSCPGCLTGAPCGTAGDCASGVCLAGACAAPICTDGVANGNETAVDCGGICPGCALGSACAVNADCASGWCASGACGGPSCTDGVANGTESDVDCGGPCSRCLRTRRCAIDTDCETGACHAERCSYAAFDLETSRTFDTRAGAYATALADLNGDGRPDWLEVEESQIYPARVAVILNAGSRRWAVPVRYVLATPWVSDVAAGDFDGDGDPDVVAVSTGEDPPSVKAALTVFRNDGTGKLVDVRETKFPFATRAVLGDVDGDGKAEIVASGGGGTAVFRVQSDLSLVRLSEYAGSIVKPVLVDIDGDGDPDLVGLGMSGVEHAVVVWVNDGTGLFSATGNYPVPGEPAGFDVGDIDGDGLLDVAVAGSNNLTVLLNRGATFVQGPSSYQLTAPGKWYKPTLGDVDADGNLDVIIPGLDNHLVLGFFYGKGDGSFTLEEQRVLHDIWAAYYADFDGDCQPDLAFPNYEGEIEILPRRSGLTWPRPATTTTIAHDLAVGDVNGDGRLDVVTVSTNEFSNGPGSIMSWSSPGTRLLGDGTRMSIEYGADRIALADFDHDGRLDIATAASQWPNVTIRHGTGDGTFASPTTFDTSRPIADLETGDWDGDGRPDLVVACGDEVEVLLGSANGSLGAPSSYTAAGASEVALGDLDGDGDLDIAGIDGTNVRFFRNDHGIIGQSVALSAPAAVTHLTLSDVDGDGKLDIVASSAASSALVVYRNLGPGSFVTTVVPTLLSPRAVGAGDVDGDGRIDLLAGSAYGYVAVHLARGGLAFDPAITFTSSPASTQETYLQPSAVAVADVDGDGMGDVVFMGVDTSVLWNASGTAPLACPTCGDGVRGDPESCDDGNLYSGDGCSAGCEREGGWTCTGIACLPVCGDGRMRGSETCDDQALKDGDGCSGSCAVENGWTCTATTASQASTCSALCGDGIVVGDELCDDHNLVDDDGCASTCRRALWARGYGDTSDQSLIALAAHPSGDVIATGYYSGTIDLGGGPFVKAPTRDVWVARIGANGSWVWSTRIGGVTGTAYPYGVATDSAGATYAVGIINGACTFGTSPYASAGSDDAFVAKLDTAGNVVWVRVLGDAKAQTALAVAVSPGGAVVVGGRFRGTIDFGGGATLTDAGGEDAWMAALDASSGEHLWSRRIGDATYSQSVGALSVDGSGTIYAAGTYAGTFDLGIASFTTDSSTNGWVGAFDPAGSALWVRSFGSNNTYESVSDVAAASSGVVAVGRFAGSVTLGGVKRTTLGSDDAFVVALDAAGGEQWSKMYGAPGPQTAWSVAVSPTGDVAVTGAFEQSVDFGDGARACNGLSDLYVTKMTSSGAQLWVSTWGSAATQTGRAIAFDAVGRIYCGGGFIGTMGFVPPPIASPSDQNAFIAKLAP